MILDVIDFIKQKSILDLLEINAGNPIEMSMSRGSTVILVGKRMELRGQKPRGRPKICGWKEDMGGGGLG